MIELFYRLVQPQFLGGLVVYFSPGVQERTAASDAYLNAAGIVLCTFLMVICYHGYVLYSLQMGMRIRLTCSGLIYKKALRLTKSVAIDGLNGQVINLMSTDVGRFDASVSLLHDLWKGPLELIVMGYLIYREIGAYGLVGIAFLLCFLPIQSKCDPIRSKRASKFNCSFLVRSLDGSSYCVLPRTNRKTNGPQGAHYERDHSSDSGHQDVHLGAVFRQSRGQNSTVRIAICI